MVEAEVTPTGRKVLIVGGVAGGASCATRILLQNGVGARNVAGGMMSRANLLTV